VEEHGELVFFVMAYVRGESLGQRVRRAGPLVPSEVRRIVRDVAWALGYAHGQGVIHRDVKPDNILLEAGSGRAMVTDFGIAHRVDMDSLGTAGQLLGTAHFMSPEQCMGDAVDGRSDLYSLGITAYYALTGTLPFDASNVPAIVGQHVNLPAPRVASGARAVPARLAEVVDRCLAKSPDDRFPSGQELAEALQESDAGHLEFTPQMRALLRQVRAFGATVGGLGMVFWASSIFSDDLLAALWQVFSGMRTQDQVVAVSLLAALVVQLCLPLFRAARQVVRDGLTQADVSRALRAEGRAVDEEAAASGETERKRARRKTWVDRASRWSGLVALGGAAVSVFGFLQGDAIAAFVAGPLFVMSGLTFWSAGPTAPEGSPLRGLGLAERLMAGRFGKALLRIAGIGVGQTEHLPTPGDDHTEILLASVAGDLFAKLDTAVRERFAEIPDVIARLEADAAALRLRERKLGEILVRAGPGWDTGPASQPPDEAEGVRQAREQVRQRLLAAVAAMEHLRLDLLRLHAGIGSADDLTIDLERARSVSVGVNAELSAREEVDRLLNRGRSDHP
jgi:eukaryotic-like serine/threonine-protein kinase